MADLMYIARMSAGAFAAEDVPLLAVLDADDPDRVRRLKAANRLVTIARGWVGSVVEQGEEASLIRLEGDSPRYELWVRNADLASPKAMAEYTFNLGGSMPHQSITERRKPLTRAMQKVASETLPSFGCNALSDGARRFADLFAEDAA